LDQIRIARLIRLTCIHAAHFHRIIRCYQKYNAKLKTSPKSGLITAWGINNYKP